MKVYYRRTGEIPIRYDNLKIDVGDGNFIITISHFSTYEHHKRLNPIRLFSILSKTRILKGYIWELADLGVIPDNGIEVKCPDIGMIKQIIEKTDFHYTEDKGKEKEVLAEFLKALYTE